MSIVKELFVKQSQESAQKLFIIYKTYSVNAHTNEDAHKLSSLILFKTPLEWMFFKAERLASFHGKQVLWKQFKLHCEKGVCAKRFDFIGKNIGSLKFFSDDDLLLDVAKNDEVLRLSMNSSLVTQWQSFEFFKKNGEFCKWENYPF